MSDNEAPPPDGSPTTQSLPFDLSLLDLDEPATDQYITSASYCDTDADFSILSSDGMYFHVHKCTLRRASALLTDTESLVNAPSLPTLSPDRETLVLSKEVTEHSIVIQAFLDLLYDHELDRETLEDSRLYRLVIRFCRDWSCDLVIRKLEKSLHFSIATDFAQPISHFLMAIELLDPLLLDLSISHPVTEAWSGIPYVFGKGSSAIPRIESAFASGLGVPSMPILASARGRFDVRSWSWELYAQVPLTVVFALVQSIGPAKEYQALDWKSIGREVSRFVAWAYNLPCVYGPDASAREHLFDEDDDYGEDDPDYQLLPFHRLVETMDPVLQRTYSENSDMVIVSSDNKSFEINASQLIRSSAVLRDMTALASPDDQRTTLNLTDETIEHSIIIEAMLDLIYDLEVISLHRVTAVIYLINLADKWEIASIKTIIEQQVERAFYLRAHCAFGLFRIAIELEAYGPAAEIIERYDQSIDSPPRPHGQDHELSPRLFDERACVPCGLNDTCYIHEIDTMPYSAFIQLPPKVSWALLRASWNWDPRGAHYRAATSNSHVRHRRKSMAMTFKHVMDPVRWPGIGVRVPYPQEDPDF